MRECMCGGSIQGKSLLSSQFYCEPNITLKNSLNRKVKGQIRSKLSANLKL